MLKLLRKRAQKCVSAKCYYYSMNMNVCAVRRWGMLTFGSCQLYVGYTDRWNQRDVSFHSSVRDLTDWWSHTVNAFEVHQLPSQTAAHSLLSNVNRPKTNEENGPGKLSDIFRLYSPSRSSFAQQSWKMAIIIKIIALRGLPCSIPLRLMKGPREQAVFKNSLWIFKSLDIISAYAKEVIVSQRI